MNLNICIQLISLCIQFGDDYNNYYNTFYLDTKSKSKIFIRPALPHTSAQWVGSVFGLISVIMATIVGVL